MSAKPEPPKPMQKLIVVVAFDPDDSGEMKPVYGPTEEQSEDRAVRTAKALATKHAAVIAWSRPADMALGEYGTATVLFKHGDVPDLE